MKFFDWLNKAFESNEPKDAMAVAVKGRFNPASTLFATTILFLTELSKTQEEMLARSEKMKIAKRVEALGFTNSYEVAEQKQYGKNVELLSFMINMWRDLGKNTILVSFSHFREILRRHDLMCVPFEAYKGDIPIDKLAEIEAAKERLAKSEKSIYSNVLWDMPKHVGTSEQLIELIRFPYYYKDREEYIDLPAPTVYLVSEPKTSGRMFIAAPKDFVEKPTVQRYVSDDESSRLSYALLRDDFEKKIRLANTILGGADNYANVRYSPAPAPLPRNYAPFVCSICDHGVIIHSMWGAEAEDATIKRYEQLRDEIIGKPKMLTV